MRFVSSTTRSCARRESTRAGNVLSDPIGTIGAYHRLELLDSGGTGHVYLARRHDEERFVALKLAKETLMARGRTAVSAFRQGLMVQRRLGDHRYIVTTHIVADAEDGRPYAAMQLVERGSLAEPLNRSRITGEPQALAFVAKVAEAVGYAHRFGVLHCDLKSSNILLSDKDDPVLIDFGHSRLLEASAQHGGVQMHGGTPGWMAPELVPAGGDLHRPDFDKMPEATTASDVFSLGILLFWLIQGRLPLGDGDDCDKRPRGVNPFVDQFLRPWSWEAEQICQKAMRKEPEQRYRHVDELQRDLRRALAGEPIEAERERPLRRKLKWVRRNRPLAVAAGTAAMVLVLLAALYVRARERDNALSAMASGIAAGELRRIGEELELLTHEEGVRAAIKKYCREGALDTPEIAPDELADVETTFDNLSVFDPQGNLCARSTEPKKPLAGVNFHWRDYVRKALLEADARRAYFGRPFQSEGDLAVQVSVGLAVWIDGNLAGVVVGHRRVGQVFRQYQLICEQVDDCMPTIIGLRDMNRDEYRACKRERLDDCLPGQFLVLAGTQIGQEVAKHGIGDHGTLLLEESLSRRISGELAMHEPELNQFRDLRRPQAVEIPDYADPTNEIPSPATIVRVGKTAIAVVIRHRSRLDVVSEWLTGVAGMLEDNLAATTGPTVRSERQGRDTVLVDLRRM